MRGRARAIALSLGMAGVTCMGCDSHKRPAEEVRPVEPRLTEASNLYHPCTVSEKASDLVPNADCGQQTRRARKKGSPSLSGGVLRGPAEDESKDPALGQRLASGNPNELNRAVRELEEKTAAGPKDPKAWSDLAAAYIVRAGNADNPRDLVRAYEAADRAVRIDGTRLEALYNRALALERLHVTGSAREAWTTYINHETESRWIREAEQRQRSVTLAANDWDQQRNLLDQAALEGNTEEVLRIVDRNRQSAREYAELMLFGKWADAVGAGDQEDAAQKLQILRLVGNALAQTSGEHLVYDSVTAIDEATNDPQRWKDLVQGTRDFRDGYVQHNSSIRAVKKLTEARDKLSRARSPLAFRAAFFLASNDYKFYQYQSAIEQTQQLIQTIKGLPYRSLRGQANWVKAVSEATLGKMPEAIADYQQAKDEFQHLGESENTLNIECRLGELLMSGGRGNEGWQSIYRALRSAPEIRNTSQLAMVFKFAGDAALQNGMDEAALAFQQERVRLSRPSSSINPLALVEALNSLARTQHHLGEREEAQASLQEAERLTETLEAKQRTRQKADIEMTRGLMMVTEDPAQAAGLLSSALSFYKKEENVIFSLWTHLARGRAYRRAGDDSRAEQDFKAALKLYDQMGENLDEEDLRLALLEETDTIFDEMVDLQADRGESQLAFAYADRARTRVLPGSASKLWTDDPGEKSRLLAVEPEPLAAKEIRRRLPEGVTLVQFSVLEDRVLIWRLRRDGSGKDFFEERIEKKKLEDMVARLRRFDQHTWSETSRNLFSHLVQPWLKDLPAEEKIVLIPDKILHWVPFAALQDASGEYLIQKHSLALAPSATLYVNALERQGSEKINFSRGLVVSQPDVDRNILGNEGLLSLPEAGKEGKQIADLTHSHLLEGKYANKANFLAEAATAEWIQFSGHAVIDPANTLLSRLVLAPGPGDNGFLTAREIYSLKLNATRLVVLAACDTGNEYVPGGEGVTSLARAFLAAGVPTVVASLWSVDDKATAQLSKAFHTNLLAGSDPVDALRKAQLGMLQNKKDQSPRAWAAFEVIGASAQGRP